ncbi:MAG: hypothetical protein JXB33_09695 [Clostridia bacterium]|nr:hypothetical protein [Clostridia bacterium]
MTPKEIVRRTIEFKNPERLAMEFWPPYVNDFKWVGMVRSVDHRPQRGVDEWGAVWENIGVCNLGEVKEFPLKDWADFNKLNIPDPKEDWRWEGLEQHVREAGDKYIEGGGISIYERVHFIRGLENTWLDIYDNRENLEMLVDILTDMSVYIVKRYAAMGIDGYAFADDWGLQNSLMISPALWREIWKPRYARIFKTCRDNGIHSIMHSCGYITDILDDLIEIGLDVIQMDQQENMGLEKLGERFRGRITFYCPVDIQQTMAHGTMDEIRAYCNRMFENLGKTEGGFIAKIYADPVGAGHTKEAIETMFDEFTRISLRHFGR